MSVLIVCKTLTPFVNTLTPDDKYSFDNKEMLPQPINSYYLRNLMFFQKFLLHFRNLYLIFNYSKKMLSLMPYAFPILQMAKDMPMYMSQESQFSTP